MKTFKFRLYPNPEQERKMLATIETCRHLWNDALAYKKHRWEEKRESTSYIHQQQMLTVVRNSDPELRQVYSQVAQDVLHRLDHAFEAFFERRARYPKFKKHSGFGSFTYPQAYNGSAKPDPQRKRLYLSKIGNVKTVFHRALPKDVMFKTCTVVNTPSNEWYASLVFENVVPLGGIEISAAHSRTAEIMPVGIDLGLKALITTSDGVEVPHPQFLRKAEERIRHLNRVLSRKRKGSKNRWKARLRVATAHAKVARQRIDFNHKLSNQLVSNYTLIAFENLKVRNMIRNHLLAKSMHDAGWSELVTFTNYKAMERGRLVVKVNPIYSTQECFYCGILNEATLDMREFGCIGCGTTLRRDQNAARIVLKRALAQVGQGMPELKPVEARPLPLLATSAASPAAEAGTKSPVVQTGMGVTHGGAETQLSNNGSTKRR